MTSISCGSPGAAATTSIRRGSRPVSTTSALLAGVQTRANWVTVFADGGYTTNVGLEDVTGGRAWIAYEYDGARARRAGSARAASLLLEEREVGPRAGAHARGRARIWQGYSDHNHGDLWKEQRYWSD